MADFYPVLSRAIAGLEDPTPEMRRAIYDRARNVLVQQLRGLDPPLSETEIARERLGLDETIARIEAEFVSRAPIDPEIAAPAPLPNTESEAAPARPAPVRRTEPDRSLQEIEDTSLSGESPPPTAQASVDRPRVLPKPAASPDRRGRGRMLIVGGGVALAVVAIATTAIYVNTIDPPPSQPRSGSESPRGATQPDSGPKINERVGADGVPAGGQPGLSSAGQRPDIAVAQRAVLYIETAENPQQPRTLQGRAFWRLDSENVGPGQPVEMVVRATVEIPDGGLSLVFTIRRNTDAAFPASHIVGLRFTRNFDDGNGAVREAGVPQFKSDEGERGAPLSAITSALGENLFVSALSNVPVEIERNIDVMTKRNWIDIPVRFASGRRGIVAFEKGLSGDQTLAEALNNWR
jgi:hypothetical protein